MEQTEGKCLEWSSLNLSISLESHKKNRDVSRFTFVITVLFSINLMGNYKLLYITNVLLS